MRHFSTIQAPSCLMINACILLKMPEGKLTLKIEYRTPSAYTQCNTFSISNVLELVACHKYSASTHIKSRIHCKRRWTFKSKHRKCNLATVQILIKNLVNTRTKS